MPDTIDIILSTDGYAPGQGPMVDPYWDAEDWHEAARGDGHSYSGAIACVRRRLDEDDAGLLRRADALCGELAEPVEWSESDEVTMRRWQQADAPRGDEPPPTLTTVQYRVAQRLAAAYGHAWARAVERPQAWDERDESEVARRLARLQQELRGLSVSVETIRALAKLDGCPTQPGILAPEVDAEGRVHHVTGSGRLRWFVHPDGAVRFEVTRPHPDLTALRRSLTEPEWRLPTDAERELEARLADQPVAVLRASVRDEVVHVEAVPGGFFARHVDALAGALRALGIEADVLTGERALCPDRTEWASMLRESGAQARAEGREESAHRHEAEAALWEP
jgi:hypothetical protein